jgi:hypothetical protein
MIVLLVLGLILIVGGLAGLFHFIAVTLPIAVLVIVVGILLVMVGGGYAGHWGNRAQPPGPPPNP